MKILCQLGACTCSKTKDFEQPSGVSCNNSQPGSDKGDARWSTLKFRCTRQGRKRESGVRSARVRVSLEDLNMNMDAVFQPSWSFLFLPSTFIDFEMCWMAENPIQTEKEQDKENSPPVPTIPFSRDPPNPRADEKLPIWNRKWESSRIFLPKIIWVISITVTV